MVNLPLYEVHKGLGYEPHEGSPVTLQLGAKKPAWTSG